MSSVDVVVPCYRYGLYLRECVGSILSQIGPKVRVLIIDDASPDDSANVAQALTREDSRVSFIHHTVNKGHIATYNEGNDWASADYTVLLSADDYLLPGALSRAAVLMNENPRVALTFGKALELYEDRSTKVVGTGIEAYDNVRSCIIPGFEFIEVSAAQNRVPTPTAVVRTSYLKRLGGYRPELPHTGDMEMWLRLAAHGSVGMIGECQAVYRRHTANMSLSYYTKGYLPDLQQRKRALECFFQTCRHVLPNAQRVNRKLMWSLGCYAIGYASSAFNESEMEICAELREFALGVCPDIKRSWPFTKLTLKQRLGRRAWAGLEPTLAKVRHPRRGEGDM
jgi:GT2 family glycosyltransferase